MIEGMIRHWIGGTIRRMFGRMIGLARVCVRGCGFKPNLSQEGTYIIYNNIKPTKSPTLLSTPLIIPRNTTITPQNTLQPYTLPPHHPSNLPKTPSNPPKTPQKLLTPT